MSDAITMCDHLAALAEKQARSGTLGHPGVPWSTLEHPGVPLSTLEYPGVPWRPAEKLVLRAAMARSRRIAAPCERPFRRKRR